MASQLIAAAPAEGAGSSGGATEFNCDAQSTVALPPARSGRCHLFSATLCHV